MNGTVGFTWPRFALILSPGSLRQENRSLDARTQTLYSGGPEIDPMSTSCFLSALNARFTFLVSATQIRNSAVIHAAWSWNTNYRQIVREELILLLASLGTRHGHGPYKCTQAKTLVNIK